MLGEAFFTKIRKQFPLLLTLTITALPLSPQYLQANTLQTDNSTQVQEDTGAKKNLPAVKKKGLSTKAKIGIGLGVAAVTVAGVALAVDNNGGGKGGGNGSSTSGKGGAPSLAEIPGSWNAYGVCHVQNITYSGTYTFYAGGTHSYNLLFTDNAHGGAQEYRSGTGQWFLNGAYFEMHNDSGSVYTGSFGSKSGFSVTTTNGWWTTTLSR